MHQKKHSTNRMLFLNDDLLTAVASNIDIVYTKRQHILVRMVQILADNTGKPLDVVTADCERDNFMSAAEALEYGLIDKVLDKR